MENMCLFFLVENIFSMLPPVLEIDQENPQNTMYRACIYRVIEARSRHRWSEIRFDGASYKVAHKVIKAGYPTDDQ